MTMATSDSVGIRDLKNSLSQYLDRVKHGDEIIVTEHGRPIARLSAIDAPTDRLAMLVASGAVRPPKTRQRQRPARRIEANGSVSELVTEQRR